jgi:hypothetical protein
MAKIFYQHWVIVRQKLLRYARTKSYRVKLAWMRNSSRQCKFNLRGLINQPLTRKIK